jgi:ectoine hydroxylase-related dioxygenase (phytanoyl-CoA dioxygenase family)
MFVEEHRRLTDDGFVILREVLARAEIDAIIDALAPFEAGRPMGRNDFEGQRSQRVYSLAGKGEVFHRLAEYPRVLAHLDASLMSGFLLSNLQSIRLHPGETPQAWHTDDAFYPVPRPRATLGLSTIWAIEDFTEDNGATELAVGSHRWGMEHPDDRRYEVKKAIMPAGSVVIFDAALWHRGGGNATTKTRLAVSPQYCQPWLRPQESQLLIVPPEAAKSCSPRLRSMLGYNIHPPFVGQVDGMHPLRLIDPEYRAHKTGAREIADKVLVRPLAGLTEKT